MVGKLAEELATEVAAARRHGGRPLLAGVASAQGAGKTTLAEALVETLARRHRLAACALSLDDFYLTRAEREWLAAAEHPLLVTRGVPGTYDLERLHQIPDALLTSARPNHVRSPRFDKAMDDRAPEAAWHRGATPVDVAILEGWCIGATPEHDSALRVPVNELERAQDPEERYRRYVNAQLAGPYRTLFRRLDRLLYLAAPGMDVVLRWRTEQERALAAERAGHAGRMMDPAALARFVQHFERLTRHMLATTPAHADVVVRLDAERVVRSVQTRVPPVATD